MRLIHTESYEKKDISSATSVLEYLWDSDKPLSALCRVQLGSTQQPVQGDYRYIVIARINEVPVLPETQVLFSVNQQQGVLQSRSFVLEPGDAVSVQVTGHPSDNEVSVRSVLVNVTPERLSDLVGDGTVLVDHNYGGTDHLRYVTSSGSGIENATVRAYLSADYDQGNTGDSFIRAQIRTGADGRWLRAMMLNPGDYKLVYFRTGAWGPDKIEVQVS